MKYKFEVREVFKTCVEIEANSRDEAYRIVEENTIKGEYDKVMDDNYSGYEFALICPICGSEIDDDDYTEVDGKVMCPCRSCAEHMKRS